MKPTVGRIVHYFTYTNPTEPRAAIVTWVHPDQSTVCLYVLHPDAQYAVSHVLFSEQPASCCWSWPPRE